MRADAGAAVFSGIGFAASLDWVDGSWGLSAAGRLLYVRAGGDVDPPRDGWVPATEGADPPPSLAVYHGTCAAGTADCVCDEGYAGVDCAMGVCARRQCACHIQTRFLLGDGVVVCARRTGHRRGVRCECDVLGQR